MINQQIGPYRINNLLGEGGMAHVLIAEKGNLGKKVALKVLKKEFLYNNHIRGRFLAEAKNMIQLNHPNIIGVQDLIDEPDFVAIELEYIEGETLKQYLERKGALLDPEIERLIEQMWSAVSYIHHKGFVHRDIKPSNFMIANNGIIKLTDFGIAKNLDNANPDYTGTGTGMVLGTPKYMSPEQVRNTKDVNAQSDIYSLGVVLWEMVTGKVPYDINTESTFDVFEKIVRQPLSKTNTIWDVIIERATSKKSGERLFKLTVNQQKPIIETKTNTGVLRQNKLLRILVAIGFILMVIFGIAWLGNNSKEELLKSETLGNNSMDETPEWKLVFEEEWNQAEQAEINQEPKQIIETYTDILERLPNEAVNEKNKVQQKIDKYQNFLVELERLAETERLKSESEKQNAREETQKSGTFTDVRDGKTYKWVKIGSQVWMAENLAYKPSSGNYWAYDNNLRNVANYGYLYDWHTACKVCPDGWHLPSKTDWKDLSNFLEGENIAGFALKSKKGWEDNGNGSNESGFNALPSGGCSEYGVSNDVGFYSYWWSSNKSIAENSLGYKLEYYSSRISNFVEYNLNGFSVRCIKD